MKKLPLKNIILTLGILIVAVHAHVPVLAGTVDTVIIGDSRCYGMASDKRGVDNKDTVYWIAEGGVTSNFINDDLAITLGNVMANAAKNTVNNDKCVNLKEIIENYDVKNVVVNLGCNGCNTTNAEKLAETLIKIDNESRCNVYYATVLPSTASASVSNEKIKAFNNVMHEQLEGSTVKIIDTYSAVVDNIDYAAYTSDGLHFDKKVYQIAFDEIKKEIIPKTTTVHVKLNVNVQ